jgi:hypothetical protein
VAALDWNGYYEYLRKFWPASSSSGHLIDLYGDAYFEGATLEQLHGCLLKARAGLGVRPTQWDETIGRQANGQRIYSRVTRTALDALISTLIDGVSEAAVRQGRVVFEGD